MPSDNRISIEVTPAQLAAVNLAVADLEIALEGLTSNISEDHKRSLPKIGDKTLAFDEKCKTYMADRPDLVPGFTDPAEVQRDRDLVAALLPVMREIAPILSDLESTILLAYSDLYVADLAFYQNTLDDLFRHERRLLSERLAGLPAEQVASMIATTLPLVQSFLSRYHASRVGDFFGSSIAPDARPDPKEKP